jgi:hypothetical protein
MKIIFPNFIKEERMKITADLVLGKLAIGDALYPISCKIRTLRDGTRKSNEVVRTVPLGLPYDPVPFPKGTWKITGLEWQKDKGFDEYSYGPVKIRTDARQWVNVWKLDRDGDYYLEKTAHRVCDDGYLLHYTPSSTTLGCIRLSSPEDAVAIANIITKALDNEIVELEVICG